MLSKCTANAEHLPSTRAQHHVVHRNVVHRNVVHRNVVHRNVVHRNVVHFYVAHPNFARPNSFSAVRAHRGSCPMIDYDSVDYFMDPSLIEDPYPYFDHLRAQCPVQPTPHRGVVAVTGYEEASEVYLNNEDFSSCISVVGVFSKY